MIRVSWSDRKPRSIGRQVRRAIAKTTPSGANTRLGVLLVAMVAVTLLGGAVMIGSVGAVHGEAPSHAGEPVSITDQQSSDAIGTLASVQSSKTKISGQIEFQHEGGHYEPVRQAEVRILRDGSVINRELATTTTDDEGYYSAYIDVEEHTGWFSDELDLYIEVRAENPAAEVVSIDNWGNFDRNLGTYAHREEATVSDGASQKTVDFSIIEQDDRRAFQIAEATLQGYEFTKEETGWARSQVKVDYPARIGGDMFISPIDRIRITRDNWGNQKDVTVHHEYGHAMKNDLYGTGAWEIPGVETWLRNEDGDWFPCHVKWSKTDETYAWYEGFAEFMEAAINDDPQVRGDLVNNKYYKMDKEGPDGCHDGSDGSEYDGAEVEGAVASILWAIYNDTGQDFDEMEAPLSEILGTVSATHGITSEKPERNVAPVYDINAFWDQFVTDDNHDALRKIFFNYGIQKPDRFDPNDNFDDAAGIDVGETIEAQLNFDDVDYFEFQAPSDGNVAVDLERQLGDARFEVIVYDSAGDIYAKSTDAPSAERTLHFPVDSADRYVIEVSHPDASSTAGAYELSVERSSRILDSDHLIQEPLEIDSTLQNLTVADDEDETDDADEGDDTSADEGDGDDGDSVWDWLSEDDDDDEDSWSIWDAWFSDDDD